MPKKLLIIDDDPDDIEFFLEAVQYLQKEIECEKVFNGEEALKKLRASNQLPDYIFLDLNLPRINGKELLFELKHEKKLKNMPVIIFSTSGIEADIIETIKMGAKSFIIKPIRVEELARKIAEELI
ncbi:MAG: response regulator [Flavisolibacter sp.]